MDNRAREFEAFIAIHGDELLTFSIHLTSDRALAQDLLQECLIRLYLKWRVAESETRLSYVKKILVRENISRWRRRRWREVQSFELVEDDLSFDFTEIVDDSAVLVQALRDLPVRERTALVLRYVHDFSVSDTGDLMQVPANTVKTLCARALEKLRLNPLLHLEYSQERENVQRPL